METNPRYAWVREGEVMIKEIMAGLGSVALPYLFVAFMLWNINPGEWSGGARFYTAATGLVLCCFSVAYVRDISRRK